MTFNFKVKVLAMSLVIWGMWFTVGEVEAAPVADHNSVSQFSSLSRSVIEAAADKKVLFMRQSTGGYINGQGLGCLAGLEWDTSYGYPQECVTYHNNINGWPWYDNTNWAWDLWPEPQANAITKIDQFISVVQQRQVNYQIIGMKYCYVDGWNQGDNVEQSYYINKMLQLESQYPTKTFIWATSALWNEPGSACDANNPFNSCLHIQEFNQQVRAYARAHNKPLYDIADIESDGGRCQVAGYEGLCTEWNSDGGGHPNIAGSIRLAKGFWWLIANLGSSTNTPAPTSTGVPGDANGDRRVDGLDYVIWLNHYGQNVSGVSNGNFNGDNTVDGRDYVIWLNSYGS